MKLIFLLNIALASSYLRLLLLCGISVGRCVEIWAPVGIFG